jgi:hypothetical protein
MEYEWENLTEFVDDNKTTFTKLEKGNKYDYIFTYTDTVSDIVITDFCDRDQLIDWRVVVTAIIKK